MLLWKTILLVLAGVMVVFIVILVIGYFVMKILGIALKTVKASMIPGLLGNLPGAFADQNPPPIRNLYRCSVRQPHCQH